MKKPVTCKFEIAYSGSQLDASGSSVSCSLAGGLKIKKISKTYEFDFTVGESISERFNVKVTFKLYKRIRDKMRTLSKTFTASPIDTGVASYPADLSCPQENTFIYSASDSFLKTKVDSWQHCAQLCAEFRDEAGNAPCFSWTFNSGDEDSLGLGAGVCRLLPHEEVFRVEVPDIQSGFHKCWIESQDMVYVDL